MNYAVIPALFVCNKFRATTAQAWKIRSGMERMMNGPVKVNGMIREIFRVVLWIFLASFGVAL